MGAGLWSLLRGKAEKLCLGDATAAGGYRVMGRFRAASGACSAAGKPGGSVVAARSP